MSRKDFIAGHVAAQGKTAIWQKGYDYQWNFNSLGNMYEAQFPNGMVGQVWMNEDVYDDEYQCVLVDNGQAVWSDVVWGLNEAEEMIALIAENRRSALRRRGSRKKGFGMKKKASSKMDFIAGYMAALKGTKTNKNASRKKAWWDSTFVDPTAGENWKFFYDTFVKYIGCGVSDDGYECAVFDTMGVWRWEVIGPGYSEIAHGECDTREEAQAACDAALAGEGVKASRKTAATRKDLIAGYMAGMKSTRRRASGLAGRGFSRKASPVLWDYFHSGNSKPLDFVDPDGVECHIEWESKWGIGRVDVDGVTVIDGLDMGEFEYALEVIESSGVDALCRESGFTLDEAIAFGAGYTSMKKASRTSRVKSLRKNAGWGDFSNPVADRMNEMFLPSYGDGDNMANQIATAVNKLVYKWFNDGDVFDNVHTGLEGFANDISGSANWLYRYVPDSKPYLERAFEPIGEAEYEAILYDVFHVTLCDEDLMLRYSELPKVGDAYDEDGPFSFVDEWEDEEDDYYW